MLQDWINEERERETLELQQRLAAQANDWERNNRPTGLLLPDGDRLNKLKEILESTNNWLNQREIEFINSSIEQVKKLQAKPELQDKANQVQNLLAVRPLDALLLAIQSTGQNLEQLPEEIINSVLSSLLNATKELRERNKLVLEGQHYIKSTAFSPDGKYIATGDGFTPVGSPGVHQVNGTLWLRDQQGKLIGKPLQGYKGQIVSIAFSSDSQYLVSSDYDTIRLWDLKGNPVGKTFQPFTGESIRSVAFAPNDQYIVSFGGNNTLNFWDFQGNLIGESLNIEALHIVFSPDNLYIISSNNMGDGSARLLDRQGNFIEELFVHNDRYLSYMAFSRDGEYLVSTGGQTIQVWDVKNKRLSEPFGRDKDTIESVGFTTDNQYVIGYCSDSSVRFWDWQESSVTVTAPLKVQNTISIAFSANSQYLLTGSSDGAIRIWDLEGKDCHSFRISENSIDSIAVSPDGQYIVSGGDLSTIQLWHVKGNRIDKPFKGHEHKIECVAFSSDNKYVVSGSFDTTIRLWNLEGENIRIIELAKEPFHFKEEVWSVKLVTFSSDNKYIVAGISTNEFDFSGLIQLLDIKGNPIGQPFGDDWRFALSPNDKHIAVGDANNTIQLWDMKGNRVGSLFRGHENSITSLAFSPDSRFIASTSQDGTVRLWDIQGNLISNFLGGQPVIFSPNGQYIASSGYDSTVKLWPGNWKTMLKVACNQLKHHPAFKNPQTEIEKQACETCKKYVWNKADSSTK